MANFINQSFVPLEAHIKEHPAWFHRFDALWIVPGTPYRDDRPVFAAIERARREGVPILGTCGGFQHMVVEFARNAAGIREAAHAETEQCGAC